MTWKDRIQKSIKRQKKDIAFHTIVGTIVTLIVIGCVHFFSSADSVPLQKDQNARLTIGMVGDMMFGRHIEVIGNKFGYEYPFQSVLPHLKHADLMTGNLESPITLKQDYHPADKEICYQTKPVVAKVLQKMGFKVVNLANNHIKDFGKRGLEDTVQTLKNENIDPVGAGENSGEASKISYQTVNNIRLATIGISDILPKSFCALKNRSGVLPANPNLVLPLVAEAKANADMVLVHIHWGLEYDSGVQPRQRDLAHALIDAGADVIIGTQSHVLGPVEVYKNGAILYSLGNFIFDQGWSTTKETALVYYKLLQDGGKRIEVHPMMISQGGPVPIKGWSGLYRREKIFSQITHGKIFSSEWKRQGDIMYLDLKGVKA